LADSAWDSDVVLTGDANDLILEPMAELLGRRAKNGDPIAILFLLELQVNYGEIEWVADCECGIDRRRVA